LRRATGDAQAAVAHAVDRCAFYGVNDLACVVPKPTSAAIRVR
jgi:hypothetical protein